MMRTNPMILVSKTVKGVHHQNTTGRRNDFMKLIYRILILLNLTALILIFIHTFLHPTPSTDIHHSNDLPLIISTPNIVETGIPEPEVIIVNNCTSCDCSKAFPVSKDHSYSLSLQEQEQIVEKNFLEHVKRIQRRFIDHPGHTLDKSTSLEDYMSFLAKRKECHLKPIFLTMARVSSELYWQLIENYFYTM
jgi:hypothetical protein